MAMCSDPAAHGDSPPWTVVTESPYELREIPTPPGAPLTLNRLSTLERGDTLTLITRGRTTTHVVAAVDPNAGTVTLHDHPTQLDTYSCLDAIRDYCSTEVQP